MCSVRPCQFHAHGESCSLRLRSDVTLWFWPGSPRLHVVCTARLCLTRLQVETHRNRVGVPASEYLLPYNVGQHRVRPHASRRLGIAIVSNSGVYVQKSLSVPPVLGGKESHIISSPDVWQPQHAPQTDGQSNVHPCAVVQGERGKWYPVMLMLPAGAAVYISAPQPSQQATVRPRLCCKPRVHDFPMCSAVVQGCIPCHDSK